MGAESVLRSAIWLALDHDLSESAIFNAERLLAIDPSHENKHLYSLVLYRLGHYKSAANAANGVYHVGCIYIYALCCEKLDMITEGISALEQTRSLWTSKDSSTLQASDTTRSVSPDAKIINILLGRLHLKRQNRKDAAKAFASSAKRNPFLWESVNNLCKMGVQLQTNALFNVSIIESSIVPTALDSDHVIPSSLKPSRLSNPDPFSTPLSDGNTTSTIIRADSTPVNGGLPLEQESNNLFRRTLMSNPPSTPTSHIQNSHTTPDISDRTSKPGNLSIPLAPQKRSSRNIGGAAGLSSGGGLHDKPALPSLDFAVPARRSLRTTAARRVDSSTNNAAVNTKISRDRVQNGRRAQLSAVATNNILSTAPSSVANSDDYQILINIYSTFTTALYHYYKYECREALACFKKLSSAQFDTAFVQAKVARCQFEMVDYQASKKAFLRLRELDKTRVEDMEYFSTLLWHLRAESELSYLAHDLIEIDRLSSQAWCALGNSFSLARETDKALKCFKRAIQLNPGSPYAHTLQAHEHINNDAYETARECFEKALRVDRFHYNAWYGLGMVYMRLGAADEAETHFLRAASINAGNIVLICCVGMIYEKKGRHAEALEQYKKACELQPDSALSRYRKARALINLKLYNAALLEFDHLVKLAPDEARVHFLLGQLYKTIRNRKEAVKHFTYALNLDPKGSHLIEEALESMS